MDLKNIKRVYLIGIGGIGMSALARYFKQKGLEVSGYDHTERPFTQKLSSEGIKVFYEDREDCLDPNADLVIYTPAIHSDNLIYQWYVGHGVQLHKRAEILGELTLDKFCIAVSGTHGKTTITTLIAHLLRVGEIEGAAFLGGVSVNYQTNFWKIGEGKQVTVEADEYDRSFLKLYPDIAVVTAMDPDHLDIYGTGEAVIDAFGEFVKNIKPGGSLWYKHGLPGGRLNCPRKHTYSLQNDAADAYADNIYVKDGGYEFDWHCGFADPISELRLNLGGMHNVENAVVAIAIAREMGVPDEKIKAGIASFKGVQRRFEYILKEDKMVFIDDYAHHPKELEALLQSAKRLFPKQKCVVAFQPHLYSRTRDLADGFVRSLSIADQVILLPIYPAREEPIPGVTSESLKEKITAVPCTVLSKDGLLEFAEKAPMDLFITAGAGDIDRLVQPLKEIFEEKLNKENE